MIKYNKMNELTKQIIRHFFIWILTFVNLTIRIKSNLMVLKWGGSMRMTVYLSQSLSKSKAHGMSALKEIYKNKEEKYQDY